MSRNLPLAKTDALRMHRTRKVRTSAVKLKSPVVKCCSSVQPDSMKGHLEVGKIGEGGKEAAPHVQIRALLQHQLLQIVVHKPKEAGHAISAQGKPNVNEQQTSCLEDRTAVQPAAYLCQTHAR